jgi:hypothetical protein
VDFNAGNAKRLLEQFDFLKLFIAELGWDRYNAELRVEISGSSFALKAVAEKRGAVAWVCQSADGGSIPERPIRQKIDRQVSKRTLEHLVIFTDESRTTQVWCWPRREVGKPTILVDHFWRARTQNTAFIQKLQGISFRLSEENELTLPSVTARLEGSLNVERVTRRFYEQFQAEHRTFLNFINGIADLADREWYASLMLNRLMFIYFMQRKGFLNSEQHYLRDRLARCQREKGQDKFYSFYRYFLLRLFHEGLGGKARNPQLDKLLGRIPYLNGGLFEKHPVEERCPDIAVPDEAFARIFAYFDRYQWHLDERPLRNQDEINPDILGYIFEKYINQKQMGAYYTKEDITEYISKNTVIPFLFDAARAKCKVAFENPGGPTIWDHLRDDPDRYVYPAVKHGLTWDIHSNKRLDEPLSLPDDIAAGIADVAARTQWNRAAPIEFALPTEIWREVVARRTRYNEVRAKLAAGEVREINDLITLNLDIRQFAQDVIERCEGPELLRAFWKTIEGVTVLDPTCGSGAFLFAALNILEPLYETCLSRMEAFVADLERSSESHSPRKFDDFKATLTKVSAHPNVRYFILKNITLNNLFGVDIMEEAVEICKLRLFLKLAAQVEPDKTHENLGIEPLPDIDFNIRAGNTLVGYATFDELKKALTSKLDLNNALGRITRSAADLQQTFDVFRQRQMEGDGSVPLRDKQELRERLKALEHELNLQLANEYGLKPGDVSAHAKWVRSHQPFHWFVEFYGIMSRGGFDVAIGNPPYVEYGKIRDVYSIGPLQYRTKTCGNLLAFVAERSRTLLGSNGRFGLVLLVSTFSTERMEPLQSLIANSCADAWISNFAWRPSKLFDGCNTINAIILASCATQSGAEIFSTKYLKWTSEERENLFHLINYGFVSPFAMRGVFPKLSSDIEENILVKIQKNRSPLSVNFRGSNQKNCLFYFRGMLYWIKVLDRIPVHREDGQEMVSGQCKRVVIQDGIPAHSIIGLLSSSLFFWYYQTFSDCQQINQREFNNFTFDPESGVLEKLKFATQRLMADYQRNSRIVVRINKKKSLSVEKQYFTINKSKHIIDEIDLILADHYKLTPEEYDFIANYDVKYRMGQSDGDDAAEDGD